MKAYPTPITTKWDMCFLNLPSISPYVKPCGNRTPGEPGLRNTGITFHHTCMNEPGPGASVGDANTTMSGPSACQPGY